MTSQYSLDCAIKMLPLVQSYCRSIRTMMLQERKRVKIKRVLESLVTLNINKRQKIKRILDRIQIKEDLDMVAAKRWRDEMNAMNLHMCSVSQGIIDIPVWDFVTEQEMHLCVAPNTTKNHLFWHLPDEGSLNSKPCWAALEIRGKHADKMPRMRQ